MNAILKATTGTLRMNLPNEPELLEHLRLKALGNVVKPGQAWVRVKTEQTGPAGQPLGERRYHLDLSQGELTVTERWEDGQEATRLFTVQVPLGPMS